MFIMKSHKMIGWACVATLVLAHGAEASFWTEVGDAGPLPATAQVVLGDSSPLTGISGTLSSVTDRDMYRIYITGGGTFSATTVGQFGTNPALDVLDTQLFLFDEFGRGVYANDDTLGAGSSQFRSTLPANHPLTPLAAGYYNLMIVASGSYPASPGGLIFPTFVSNPANATAVLGPTGPGGGSAISTYIGDPVVTGTATESGTYRIALTGALAVPEPSSLAMILIAATGPITFALARTKARESRVPRAA